MHRLHRSLGGASIPADPRHPPGGQALMVKKQVPEMEIMVAKRAGFCFGVKRAIDITVGMAKEQKEGLYTLGPLIHNPQVIEKLGQEGISPVDIRDLEGKNISSLIIRTHGIPWQQYAEIV